MKKIFASEGLITGVNLAHVATLSIDIYSFAKKHNFNLQVGHDELDLYDSLNLCSADKFKFCLIKYKNLPAGTVELFFESQLRNWQEQFDNILKIINCDSEKILWLNHDYFKTP
jgi:predicted nuclease of predicted toxin-antitoxin system